MISKSMIQKENVSGYDMLFIGLSFLFLSFIYGGVWLFVPFFNGTVAFGFSLIIVILSLFNYQIVNDFFKKQYGSGFIVFLLLTFVYMLTQHEKFTESHFLIAFYAMVISLIGVYVSWHTTLKAIFLRLLMLDLVIKMCVNLYFSFLNPEMIRSSQFEVYSVNGSGLEKMVNIYLLYYLSTICFILIANLSQINRKIFAVMFVVCSFVLMYRAEMTLVMLTTYILSLYMFLFNVKTRKSAIIGGMIVLILLLVFSKNILEYAINQQSFGKNTTSRLQDVYSIFFKGQSFLDNVEIYNANAFRYKNSSTIMRLVAYTKSVKALFHNFFFGIWTSNAYTNGGHSLWLDYISQYGILIVLFYRALIKYQKDLLNSTQINNRKAVTCFMIAYIILGIINYFAITSLCIMLYIILPNLHEIFIWRKHEQE